MIIVGMPNSVLLGKKIAQHLKVDFSELNVSHFPDGEIHMRYMCEVKRKKVVLVQTLTNPNEAIMQVVFAAKTAKDLGAHSVTLIAPYLAYMRQDTRFRKGDCISAEVTGKLLSKFIDELITIDPHLHRIHHLKKIYKIKTQTLTADSLVADYIKKHIKRPIIVGPDEESYQWALDIAREANCKAMILHKRRYSSTHVEIDFDEKVDFSKNNLILIDDMISTGHTMFEVIKDAKKLGAKNITCIAVHGLFTEKAYPKFKRLKSKVVTCNTISHPSNGIDVSKLLAGAL